MSWPRRWSACCPGVVVAADLVQARDLVRAHPALRAVTRQGEVLGAHWASGGSARPPSVLTLRSVADEAADGLDAAEPPLRAGAERAHGRRRPWRSRPARPWPQPGGHPAGGRGRGRDLRPARPPGRCRAGRPGGGPAPGGGHRRRAPGRGSGPGVGTGPGSRPWPRPSRPRVGGARPGPPHATDGGPGQPADHGQAAPAGTSSPPRSPPRGTPRWTRGWKSGPRRSGSAPSPAGRTRWSPPPPRSARRRRRDAGPAGAAGSGRRWWPGRSPRAPRGRWPGSTESLAMASQQRQAAEQASKGRAVALKEVRAHGPATSRPSSTGWWTPRTGPRWPGPSTGCGWSSWPPGPPRVRGDPGSAGRRVRPRGAGPADRAGGPGQHAPQLPLTAPQAR